ncbi:hypothetical protein KIN20_030856 [Parelaphostrongylus tenuis]|uniref:Uncharacterized protein n=1 Tax=Parelaphostrongylus tenuis TaxID=148309 RepID=A0AAD5WGM3_PARTN|nr:hypothetical protein KIN20_030856 [Parelaphostrongylus tenuis]
MKTVKNAEITVAVDAVSEAASRGYLAVDRMMREFNIATSATRRLFRENTQAALDSFAGIADSMRPELVSRHEELDRKVGRAVVMRNKLEKLPEAIKSVGDEFLEKIFAVVMEATFGISRQDGVSRNINPVGGGTSEIPSENPLNEN